MEEGRRYENLSWRLWNRETFCCESQIPASAAPNAAHDHHNAITTTTTNPSVRTRRRPTHARPESDDLPELSASVDSAVSDRDEGDEDAATAGAGTVTGSCSAPLDIEQPRIRRLDSFESRSRGREKHITSFRLERMFTTIKETKDLEPLSFSSTTHPIPTTSSRSTDTTPRPASQHISVVTPSIELSSAGSKRGVERAPGSPCPDASSRQSPLEPSSMTSDLTPVRDDQRKKTNVFMLGASSGEDESSLEEHMRPSPVAPPHRSSLSDGLKQPISHKKQTSFKEEVATRTISERAPHDDDSVFTEDDEDDEEDEDVVSESAIDDDDSSDWDSVTESGRSSVDEKPLFQRVDSKLTLTSRRSLLTNLLHQPQRAAAFAQAAAQSTSALHRSRTSSPNGPSMAASPEDEDEDEEEGGSTLEMRVPGITRSKPIIMTTSNSHPPSLSPRTTRRNMLATELTESLRKHLLWERQQKHTTASAVLKRRHTAHDMANLHDYPNERHGLTSREASKNNSWNHYFDLGLGEYHQKGW